jgi:hypothetical protein
MVYLSTLSVSSAQIVVGASKQFEASQAELVAKQAELVAKKAELDEMAAEITQLEKKKHETNGNSEL